MPTTRNQFSQLIAPGLLKVIFQTLEQFPEEYSHFLKVAPTDRAYEEDQIIAGLGAIKKKPEGKPIEYDDPIQGGSVRYIPDSFALAWQITREARDDEKYNVFRRVPEALSRSMKDKVERIGADVLNLSFTTLTTADGVSFMNTAHPLLGGGTYSNRLNPDAGISVTAIQDMIILFENMVDERNLRMQLRPQYLWIPPEQQFIVSRVLQSSMDPESGNRSVNPVYGRLEPYVLHFLSATTPWWVSSGDYYNYAQFFWRTKPEMESTDDFETKGTKHSIFFRCVAGVTDWRGWAGSNP